MKRLLVVTLSLTVGTLLLVLSALAEERAVLGSEAPQFSLLDQDGKTVSLSDFSGKVVVLEWTNPDCPYVKRHYKTETMKRLAEKYQAKVEWLAINSTHYMDQAANKQWSEQNGLRFPVLSDASGGVGKLYGAKTTPHMFVVDPSGKLAYRGAIDDDPYGEKSSPKNFVDLGIGELLGGNGIAQSDTTPYGCSVKYAQG